MKKKYYLNPDFEALPQEIQDELKILCVLYTEDVGGKSSHSSLKKMGTLCFEVTTEDFDPMFDEIGSKLKIKEIQQTKEELLRSLELYYKVFFLGEEI